MHSSLGIDYGTNSVRAVIVDCSNGAELGSSVVDYPSGHQGVLLDRNNHHLARQNPADYLYGLENCVRGAIEQAKKSGFSPETLVGIGVDTTGSSPMPVDASNNALALAPEWKNDLNAQCWLWKDHTSHRGGRNYYPARRGASSAIYRKVRQHLFFRVVLVEDLALSESCAGDL